MSPAVPRFLFSWLLWRRVAFVACAMAIFASCSNQGEGEICDLRAGTNQGTSDCQDNLVCTRRPNFVINPTGCPNCYGVCCPLTGGTTTACSGSTSQMQNPGPTSGDASDESALDEAGSDGARDGATEDAAAE
jgi:hypothetical protein